MRKENISLKKEIEENQIEKKEVNKKKSPRLKSARGKGFNSNKKKSPQLKSARGKGFNNDKKKSPWLKSARGKGLTAFSFIHSKFMGREKKSISLKIEAEEKPIPKIKKQIKQISTTKVLTTFSLIH